MIAFASDNKLLNGRVELQRIVSRVDEAKVTTVGLSADLRYVLHVEPVVLELYPVVLGLDGMGREEQVVLDVLNAALQAAQAKCGVRLQQLSNDGLGVRVEPATSEATSLSLS